MRRGLEYDPSEKILSKTLTAERIDRLNSIGFVWSVQGPKVSWDERFAACLEYYEDNGKWPSQSMGSLGEWVHKQRQNYARNDATFMRERAPKVNAAAKNVVYVSL